MSANDLRQTSFLSRYYAICHPLKAQYTCTHRRMLKLVVAVWIIAASACAPYLWIPLFKDSTWLDGTPVKVCRLYIR